jgi:RNA polymerase sigma-70 factor (ECF subfamily)
MENKEEYFEQLLSVKNELEKFAVFLTRNRDSAKDLVSEVIVLGFDSYEKLKNVSSFKSYLFTICIRAFYKLKKRNQNFDSFEENELEGFYSDSNADYLYDVGLLYSAIDKLKSKEKEVLILAELMGYKHREIAEILKLSEANVKVIVFRAKQKLKELLVDTK